MLMKSEVLGGVMIGGIFKVVSEFENHLGLKDFSALNDKIILLYVCISIFFINLYKFLIICRSKVVFLKFCFFTSKIFI